VPCEFAIVVRVLELVGAPFQTGVNLIQDGHVGRIDGVSDGLVGAAIAGQHKLHGPYRRDQCDHREFAEATGFLHLRILNAKAVRFQ
jgi:hypothetical protein